MKKIHIVCLIATIVLAASCNTSDEYSLNRRGLVKFHAALVDAPMSKTVLQSDGSLYWTPGNAINLFFGSSGSARFESDITSPSAQSNFIGSLDGFLPNGIDYFWAIYPYDADNSYDGSSVTITLPDEQTAVAGTFADDLFISVARSVDYTLQFYNVCGGVKFSVANEGIKYVTLKGNGGEVLAGHVKVAFGSDGKPYVQQVVDGETEIRVNAPGGGTFMPGEWYYIVALPTTFSSGYTMDFYKDELFVERTTESPIAINRSVWGKLPQADNVVTPITANKYLTFTSEGITYLSLDNYGGNDPDIFFSQDATSWTKWDYNNLIITSSEPLYLCGVNPEGFSKDFNWTQYSTFVATGDKFSISGDIMSLIDKDQDVYIIPNDGCFCQLFSDCTILTSAPELPATQLTWACYSSMFRNCTSLITAPELPATSLANVCYGAMFNGCTSLIAAPELSATTLAPGCYSDMFSCCSSLTQAPELPATRLVERCYSSMFSGCESLKTAPSLPATSLADRCYIGMFSYCTNLSSAPALEAATLAPYCYADMFWGCTSLEVAPELPATILAEGCYCYMFAECSALVEPPTLPASTLQKDCYAMMFVDCTSLTTAPILPALSLDYYCYGAMFAGCTSLVVAPELPATTMGSSCYEDMFVGCTSLVTAPSLPAANLAENCYASMFSGCISLEVAPELPATILADGCYSNMFVGCTNLISAPELIASALTDFCYCGMFRDCVNLNYIKCLATDLGNSSCLGGWVDGVAVEGTFVKAESIQVLYDSSWGYHNFRWIRGSDGIPEGWAILNDGEPSSNVNSYLTLASDGTTSIAIENYGGNAPLLYYSIDATNWVEWDYSSLTFSSNAPLYLCGDNPDGFNSNTRRSVFTASGSSFGVIGNLMSLISKDDYVTTIPNDNCFYRLFEDCSQLASAPDLPATSLTYGCYRSMFSGCTGLVTAPELPATTIPMAAYVEMFKGCSSLVSAPELPATILDQSCYGNMFEDCTNLVTAPNLPATDLTDFCYSLMFKGCTKLLAAPELPATVLAKYCYAAMFTDCTSLVSSPTLPATTLDESCYAEMFVGCTSLSTAPELPATTMQDECYYRMFEGCTSLTTAPTLPATVLEKQCYWEMFKGCSSLNYVKCLATYIRDTQAVNAWLNGVSSTGTFVKAASMSGWSTGNSGIPKNWTVVDAE